MKRLEKAGKLVPETQNRDSKRRTMCKQFSDLCCKQKCEGPEEEAGGGLPWGTGSGKQSHAERFLVEFNLRGRMFSDDAVRKGERAGVNGL